MNVFFTKLFHEEFFPLRDRLFGIAVKWTRDEDQAKDLVADTFERIWKYIDRYEPGSNAMGYAFRIMRRVFLNDLRKSDRRGAQVSLDDGLYRLTDTETQQLVFIQFIELLETGDFSAVDLSDEVVSALKTIAPIDLEILIDSVMGVKNEETAKRLGMNVNTVKVRLHRVRKWLIKLLEEYARSTYNIAKERHNGKSGLK